MKFERQDASNCNADEKQIGGLSSYLKPCSERNGSFVCKNDYECLNMEVLHQYNPYNYRLRPCTDSRMTSASLGCFCQYPNAIGNGRVCESSGRCERGYRCATSSMFGAGACVSCLADSSFLEFLDDGTPFCDGRTIATGETPQPQEADESVMPLLFHETPQPVQEDDPVLP